MYAIILITELDLTKIDIKEYNMKSQNVTIIVDENESTGKIYIEDNIINLDFGITKQIIDFNDIKVVEKNDDKSISIVLSDNSLITLKFKEYLVLYKLISEHLEKKKTTYNDNKNKKKCPECGEINNLINSTCTNCGFPFKKNIDITSHIKPYIRLFLYIFIIIGLFYIEFKGNLFERLLQINYTDSKCFEVKKGVIKNYNSNCTKNVKIPYMINHRFITKIDKSAFVTKNIESVKLPIFLKEIDDFAFHGNKIKKIEIPKYVTRINSNAFSENYIKTIIFNNDLKMIGDRVFSFNYIENLVITDSVENIGERAFANNNLKKITIGKKVMTIEFGAFAQEEKDKSQGDSENNQQLSEIINKSNHKYEWNKIFGFGGYLNAPELWIEKGEVNTKYGTIIIKN